MYKLEVVRSPQQPERLQLLLVGFVYKNITVQILNMLHSMVCAICHLLIYILWTARLVQKVGDADSYFQYGHLTHAIVL